MENEIIKQESSRSLLSEIADSVQTSYVIFAMENLAEDVFNAVNGECTKVRDAIGTEMVLKNILFTKDYVHEVYGNPDSKLIEKTLVHVFTKDGIHFRTGAKPIIKAALCVISAKESGVAPDEIKFMFTEILTPKGVTYGMKLI